MEWSLKRKIFYALVIALVLAILSAYPIYRIANPTPTCFDGKQNGTEFGLDCGGECLRMCLTQVKPVSVVWSKAFLVTAGNYDIGAYIENLNFAAGIKNLRYTMLVKDGSGQVLAEREGVMELPPASTVLLFESRVSVKGSPETVDIEFNKEDITLWVKAETLPTMVVTKNQTLKNTDTKPRLDAILTNTDLVNDVGQVTISAVIYDPMRRPVAVSRTYVDVVPKGGEQPVFFTWPNRFTKNPRGGMCRTPVDTILVFDRSGSMDVGRQTPSEPLTTAKNAAISYVSSVDVLDKVGLVSFATTVSIPIDHDLSIDHQSVQNAVSGIFIEKGSIQYTNLGDALKSATLEFASSRHTRDAKRIIVALTDGVANRPLDSANSKNTAHAEEYAVVQAQAARSAGIELYTIGLGKDLNETFLRDRIATSPAHYSSAPTAQDLQSVYKKIAEGVCKEENFIKEIIVMPRAVFVK